MVLTSMDAVTRRTTTTVTRRSAAGMASVLEKANASLLRLLGLNQRKPVSASLTFLLTIDVDVVCSYYRV
jgi:hypothetical protein